MSEISWRFCTAIIEDALAHSLAGPLDDERGTLLEAMRYAVFSGGKRLRSQLVLETAAVVGGNDFHESIALPAACAIEFIHAYSLVHDDLPAMDNSDLRRGQPSCHKKFGEANAILAGDALLTLAFDVLTWDYESRDAITLRRTISVTGLIARAAGQAGMVGGQAIDLAWSDNHITSVSGDALMQMHAMKTGALIRVACEVGAVLGGGTAAQVEAMSTYGAHLGRAFQITDDLLDVAGDPQHTGKAATDAANNKITAPAIFGVQRSRELAREAGLAAVAALGEFGSEADALRQLARSLVGRKM
jgi:geranylgeranyl diphosphate synthase type II